MTTNLNIDLTTRYCPVEYKGQQWVKLYYTPRDKNGQSRQNRLDNYYSYNDALACRNTKCN